MHMKRVLAYAGAWPYAAHDVVFCDQFIGRLTPVVRRFRTLGLRWVPRRGATAIHAVRDRPAIDHTHRRGFGLARTAQHSRFRTQGSVIFGLSGTLAPRLPLRNPAFRALRTDGHAAERLECNERQIFDSAHAGAAIPLSASSGQTCSFRSKPPIAIRPRSCRARSRPGSPPRDVPSAACSTFVLYPNTFSPFASNS